MCYHIRRKWQKLPVKEKNMEIYTELKNPDFKSITQLKNDFRYESGYEINYRLYEIRIGERVNFVVDVTLGCENRSCYFGSDLDSAEQMYRLIVDGSVTPCTLLDVAEDFGFLCDPAI